jgi:uncharacterized protein (TIGR02594 family)
VGTIKENTVVTKPKYYPEAERLVGVKEVPGKGSNEKIDELFDEVGHPKENDATPWCAAFVGGCLVRGNKRSTETLLARDYASDKFSDRFDKLEKPELYSIGVMKRGTGWQGHVGFVSAFDKDTVTLLGGNQSDAVNYRVFPRSAFVGPGLGFVKPKAKSTDVSIKDLKKDSRSLKVGGWFEKLQVAIAAAVGAAYTVWDAGKQFITDNTGLVLVGTAALAWFGFNVLKAYRVNEYREGRYLPKAHE